MKELDFIDEEFNVGDRIIVKGYDDMVREYGVYEFNKDIRCPKGYMTPFTYEMIRFCDKSGTVTDVFRDEYTGDTEIEIDFDDKSLNNNHYSFVDYMIEKDILAGVTLPDAMQLYGFL